MLENTKYSRNLYHINQKHQEFQVFFYIVEVIRFILNSEFWLHVYIMCSFILDQTCFIYQQSPRVPWEMSSGTGRDLYTTQSEYCSWSSSSVRISPHRNQVGLGLKVRGVWYRDFMLAGKSSSSYNVFLCQTNHVNITFVYNYNPQ